MIVAATAAIPTPPTNFVFNFCFFKSACNFLDNSCANVNWLDLVSNIVLKLLICKSKLVIILSFKITFFTYAK